MTAKTQTALIIGCGIAGPATALFLRRAGIEATIYEAQPAPDDFAGLFLTVATNGMHVLQTLDVATEVAAAGFATPRLAMWSSSGKRLGEVRVGPSIKQDTTSTTVRRGVLQRILREQALRQGIKIEFGKRLTSVDVVGQQVTAHFEDDSRATGDFLAGCDGIHSRTRRFVDASAPQPSYTGLLSGGGFAQNGALSTPLAPTPDTMHMIFGKRAFFGYLVKPDGDIYWFENHRYPDESRRSELAAIPPAQWRETLLQLHHGDQPLISDVMQATDEIGMYSIHDMPTLSRWHSGPLVLLGDAAHATSPSAGQGASLALEDAIVLAQCVRDVSPIESALATYEQLRRERAEKIVQFSRERGNNKAVRNPIARWLRDLMLPVALKRFTRPSALDWMYAYQVDWKREATRVQQLSTK